MKKRIVVLIICVLLVGQVVTMLVAVGSLAMDDIAKVLPPMAITFAVLLVVAIIVSGRLAKSILAPFNQLYQSIRGYMEGETQGLTIDSKYDELKNISRAFSELSQQLNEYIYRAKQENQKSALILNNISEGILVLDEDQDVLLINDRAREILNADKDITNVNIIHFVDNPKILKKLDSAFEKRKSKTFDMPDAATGNTYRYHTSIVRESEFQSGGDGMLVLITDVTDLMQAEQVRKDFTANVNKQLHEPLAAIREQAKLAREKTEKGTPANDFARKIFNEADALNGLLKDTMQIAELEGLEDEDIKVPLNLAETAKQVATSLADKAQEADVSVEVEGEADIKANAERMRELLWNLCDNAIKYNHPGGDVRIALEQDEKNVYIRATDTGVGIPEDEAARIYERFYRVKDSAAGNDDIPGTGLGLSIVKHIVQLYDGDIRLTSEKGKGSVFEISLPRKKKKK